MLPSNATGLPKDSVVNVSQLLTIDKTSLTERICSVPISFQNRIDEGLRVVLCL